MPSVYQHGHLWKEHRALRPNLERSAISQGSPPTLLHFREAAKLSNPCPVKVDADITPIKLQTQPLGFIFSEAKHLHVPHEGSLFHRQALPDMRCSGLRAAAGHYVQGGWQQCTPRPDR
jgi:hypothetical protein